MAVRGTQKTMLPTESPAQSQNRAMMGTASAHARHLAGSVATWPACRTCGVDVHCFGGSQPQAQIPCSDSPISRCFHFRWGPYVLPCSRYVVGTYLPVWPRDKSSPYVPAVVVRGGQGRCRRRRGRLKMALQLWSDTHSCLWADEHSVCHRGGHQPLWPASLSPPASHGCQLPTEADTAASAVSAGKANMPSPSSTMMAHIFHVSRVSPLDATLLHAYVLGVARIPRR